MRFGLSLVVKLSCRMGWEQREGACHSALEWAEGFWEWGHVGPGQRMELAAQCRGRGCGSELRAPQWPGEATSCVCWGLGGTQQDAAYVGTVHRVQVLGE